MVHAAREEEASRRVEGLVVSKCIECTGIAKTALNYPTQDWTHKSQNALLVPLPSSDEHGGLRAVRWVQAPEAHRFVHGRGRQDLWR